MNNKLTRLVKRTTAIERGFIVTQLIKTINDKIINKEIDSCGAFELGLVVGYFSTIDQLIGSVELNDSIKTVVQTMMKCFDKYKLWPVIEEFESIIKEAESENE